MPTFRYELNQVLPSNPEILDCPAKLYDTQIDLLVEGYHKLSEIKPPIISDGTIVAAVLGPVACYGCEQLCPEAYVTLELSALHRIDRRQIKNAVAPITINHTDTNNPFVTALENKDMVRSDNLLHNSPEQSTICEDNIILKSKSTLAADPDGTVYSYSEYFQPELEFPSI